MRPAPWTDTKNLAEFLSLAPAPPRKAHSEQRIQALTRVQVRGALRVQSVTPDPGVESCLHLSGALWIRGPQARILFRNGGGSDPTQGTDRVVTDYPLLPPDSGVLFRERLIRCSCPEPLVWISFADLRHNVLMSAVCLGRADSEPLSVNPVFEVDAFATAWLGERRPVRNGPLLELKGKLDIPIGIMMRVALAPSCNRFGDPAEGTEAADLEVVPRDTTLAFSLRTVEPAPRGHSRISMSLCGWNGDEVSREMMVG